MLLETSVPCTMQPFMIGRGKLGEPWRKCHNLGNKTKGWSYQFSLIPERQSDIPPLTSPRTQFHIQSLPTPTMRREFTRTSPYDTHRQVFLPFLSRLQNANINHGARFSKTTTRTRHGNSGIQHFPMHSISRAPSILTLANLYDPARQFRIRTTWVWVGCSTRHLPVFFSSSVKHIGNHRSVVSHFESLLAQF